MKVERQDPSMSRSWQSVVASICVFVLEVVICCGSDLKDDLSSWWMVTSSGLRGLQYIHKLLTGRSISVVGGCPSLLIGCRSLTSWRWCWHLSCWHQKHLTDQTGLSSMATALLETEDHASSLMQVRTNRCWVAVLPLVILSLIVLHLFCSFPCSLFLFLRLFISHHIFVTWIAQPFFHLFSPSDDWTPVFRPLTWQDLFDLLLCCSDKASAEC